MYWRLGVNWIQLKWMVAAIVAILSTPSLASDRAGDRAGNYSAFPPSPSNLNLGFGFSSGWNFSSNANSGFFLGTSANNFGSGSNNIDSPSNTKSWGLFANSGSTAEAFRGFTGALSQNQWFGISMDNGGIDSGRGVGFSLRNSVGDNLFEVYFTGGQTNYKYTSNGNEQDSGISFTGDGIRVDFQLTSSNGYEFRLRKPAAGSGTVFTGLLRSVANQNITSVRIWNFSAGNGSSNDAFFNEVVIPEPTSASTVLLLSMLLKRRRGASSQT